MDGLSKLTPQQKQLLRQTWERFIGDDMDKRGLAMFVKMLTDKPNLKPLFPFCEHLPAEKLPECLSLKRHGFNVILSMSRTIAMIEQQRQLEWNMNSLGIRHGYRGVKPEYFKDMQEALEFVMKEQLGSEYTPEVKTVVSIWFEAISAGMSNGVRNSYR